MLTSQPVMLLPRLPSMSFLHAELDGYDRGVVEYDVDVEDLEELAGVVLGIWERP